MNKFKKIIVAASLLTAFGAPNVMAAEPSANLSQVAEAAKQKALIKELVTEFNKHADELQVTPEKPYKEIKLSNGYTIFAQLNSKPTQQITPQGQYGTLAERTNEIQSVHGFKNLYDQVVVQLITTSTWTFDFDKVLSGKTTATAEPKMIMWAVKDKSVSGPVVGEYGKYWEYTATGTFAYNVAGVEFDTLELITHHRLKYNGEYSWKYEFVD